MVGAVVLDPLEAAEAAVEASAAASPRRWSRPHPPPAPLLPPGHAARAPLPHRHRPRSPTRPAATLPVVRRRRRRAWTRRRRPPARARRPPVASSSAWSSPRPPLNAHAPVSGVAGGDREWLRHAHGSHTRARLSTALLEQGALRREPSRTPPSSTRRSDRAAATAPTRRGRRALRRLRRRSAERTRRGGDLASFRDAATGLVSDQPRRGARCGGASCRRSVGARSSCSAGTRPSRHGEPSSHPARRTMRGAGERGALEPGDDPVPAECREPRLGRERLCRRAGRSPGPAERAIACGRSCRAVGRGRPPLEPRAGTASRSTPPGRQRSRGEPRPPAVRCAGGPALGPDGCDPCSARVGPEVQPVKRGRSDRLGRRTTGGGRSRRRLRRSKGHDAVAAITPAEHRFRRTGAGATAPPGAGLTAATAPPPPRTPGTAAPPLPRLPPPSPPGRAFRPWPHQGAGSRGAAAAHPRSHPGAAVAGPGATVRAVPPPSPPAPPPSMPSPPPPPPPATTSALGAGEDLGHAAPPTAERALSSPPDPPPLTPLALLLPLLSPAGAADHLHGERLTWRHGELGGDLAAEATRPLAAGSLLVSPDDARRRRRRPRRSPRRHRRGRRTPSPASKVADAASGAAGASCAVAGPPARTSPPTPAARRSAAAAEVRFIANVAPAADDPRSPILRRLHVLTQAPSQAKSPGTSFVDDSPARPNAPCRSKR